MHHNNHRNNHRLFLVEVVEHIPVVVVLEDLVGNNPVAVEVPVGSSLAVVVDLAGSTDETCVKSVGNNEIKSSDKLE